MQISGGVDPRGFQKCGGRDPCDPPVATPLRVSIRAVYRTSMRRSRQELGLHLSPPEIERYEHCSPPW